MSYSAYLRTELDNFSFNYQHYSQKWQNRFKDLRVAHATGYKNFINNLPKARGGLSIPQDVLEDSAEVLSNVIVAAMSLNGGPAIIAIPIVFGIKKLGGLLHVEPKQLPSFDVAEGKPKFDEMERIFGLATEAMGDQISMLRFKAKDLNDVYIDSSYAMGQRIRETMSKLLLSPLWYPPSPTATNPNRLAAPFEMRMWFRYWKYLNDTESIWAYNMTKLPDLSPMFKRLKELSWRPTHINYEGKTVNIINWDKVDAYYKMSSWNQDNFAFQPVYEAIKHLPAYVKYHQTSPHVQIPHKFPQEVDEYLKKMHRVHVRYDMVVPSADHLLSPATMTWATVTSWQTED